jgi:Amt family ammonium transporter
MSKAPAAAGQQLNNLPYVPWYEYNNTGVATGGDSLQDDLNIYYQSGDIAWMLTSTALVLLMIPGVGYVLVSDPVAAIMLTHIVSSFFYSGLARRKSALSLIWLSIMSVGVVSFQWFFW